MKNDLKIITRSTDPNGLISCQVPITQEQWLNIISDKAIVGTQCMSVLLSFYFMPNHAASCTQCSQEYGYHANTYNSAISALGKAVTKRMKTFQIIDETGEKCYWLVAMQCGYNSKNGFVWQLRSELVTALERHVIHDAINRYLADARNHWCDESYKWRAVKWFQDHWDINAPDFPLMLESALGKTKNLLDSMQSYPKGSIISFAQKDPMRVKQMFERLYDESEPLESRVQSFMTDAEALRVIHNPGNWNNHYQSANAISTYLWLRYPDKYYVYKYSEYKAVARKLGLDYTFKKSRNVQELVKGFETYDMLNSLLSVNLNFVKGTRLRLAEDADLYPDMALRTATFDFGFWISRWYTTPKNQLYAPNISEMDPFIKQAADVLRHKKNVILQGAPGTGKTYRTASLALAVIDNAVPQSHQEVMARYEQLQREGRIGFTTFHQSTDYESFIERIMPQYESGNVSYGIDDGIFKKISIAAQVAMDVAETGTGTLLDGINENPTIWKVSLEGTGDNPTRRDCMKNGFIRIGWSAYGNIDFADDNPQVTEGRGILRTFQKDMRIGDIVVSCWSQDETDAIGIITGDYEFRPEGHDLPRYRTVRWIVKGIKHNIRDINHGKHMTLGTVYRLSINLKDILDIVEEYSQPTKIASDDKPYVLIIDEINRGNVSKIFGELITLIEKDKRLGDEHPITITLPYSRKSFGVPRNLYIIGTMNTTDRSTGTIDYAIRRRFAFITTPADENAIADSTAKTLFADIKRFIERHKYADTNIDDLMIGHSYFMADEEVLPLKIKYEVIPLIKEYIKDGIISVKPHEARLHFDAWQSLEPFEPLNDDNAEGTSAD